MLCSFGLAFLAALTCGPVVLLSAVVDAQSTVGNRASCESSGLEVALNLVREELRDVKSACASNQQLSSAVDTSSLCE